MEINTYIRKLKDLNACAEAVEKAHEYQTSTELWADCKRGDWMLWLIGKLSGEPGSDKRKRLVLTACKCARLALLYVPKDELRPLLAIETAEQWAKGENKVTLDDVRKAASASYTASASSAAAAVYAAAAAAAAAACAADVADVAAAADAAYAAAYAADVAVDAAAYAVDAAAYAAADAAAAAVRQTVLSQCADIVRTDYPNVDDLWEGLK